ncbi:hypothetical protein F3Y22_tig00110450pilonHSYRG00514 [Hibiscus syriacus]|uniref:CCHC-type domain-containing protein n=1 Tax=Hibiscus syriacus TaxID=106335 RepID=A0A6A3AJ12_HIBSY|nr:hypothetical protein F3Y22_tig00110450pilonHSYRG00514 [Hibiscus syriacus]
MQDTVMEAADQNPPMQSYAGILAGKSQNDRQKVGIHGNLDDDFDILDEDIITALVTIHAHGFGERVFPCSFSKRRDYIKVLAEFPWMVYGQYLMVQPWNMDFRTLQVYPTTVVAWIRFPGLPKYLYNSKILTSIGSLVGKVAKLDFNKGTNNRRRFARVAVYIDLTRPLISKVVVGDKIQPVEYENLPLICFTCGRFGHVKEACNIHNQNQDSLSPSQSNVTVTQPKVISDQAANSAVANGTRQTGNSPSALGPTNAPHTSKNKYLHALAAAQEATSVDELSSASSEPNKIFLEIGGVSSKGRVFGIGFAAPIYYNTSQTSVFSAIQPLMRPTFRGSTSTSMPLQPQTRGSIPLAPFTQPPNNQEEAYYSIPPSQQCNEDNAS